MKKSLVYVLFVLMVLGVGMSCEKSGDDALFTATPLKVKKFGKKDDMKVKPFKARFHTLRNYSQTELCDEASFLDYNFQKGGGNATHLGKFITEIYFCVDLSTFTYKNGSGFFMAANGDKLFFDVPTAGEVGQIMPLPAPHPLYEFFFQDPFTFTGGTGRFEGASGGGVSDSYVDLFDDNGNFIPEHQTDHVWTGTLILP